jgi:hypothetical protein
MAKKPSISTDAPPASPGKRANRSGLLLGGIMLVCLAVAFCHHTADPSLVASSSTPNIADRLATVPKTIRLALTNNSGKVFGERMILQTKIEAAGGIEHLLSVCAFPHLAIGSTEEWAKANVDQGLSRGVMTVEEVKTWYDAGKAALEKALPSPTPAQCQQELMEFNQTGPARYLETRGITGSMSQLKAHPSTPVPQTH